MTLRKALLTATVLALPVAASAQPINGLYVSAGAGANWLTQTKATSNSGGNGRISGSRAGLDGFLALGWGYANGFRTEAEIVGIDNSVKLRAISAAGGAQQVTYGLMINGLYDFNTNSSITPYLGLGAGYVGVKENSFGVSTTSPTSNFAGKSGALGSFAAQGIAGVSFKVAPQLALNVDYRLLDKVQNRVYGGTVTPGGPASVKIGNEMNHSVNVGLTYAFGAAPAAAPAPAPAPAAAVAPAPAPARSYLVFFDWDKADLTARAQQIIAEAARNATKVGSTRIDVAGHADKSGTAAYNQTLSLARANNVAAELVRLGVAKTAISITAFGDTKPLVPTADGVREPQNRRVEIVLK